jgi:SAM-dependent methyltransferase
MRDYKHLDRYLTTLASDIYPQPEDSGHTALAHKVIDFWMSKMTSCTSVLDVGCGTGFCEDMFKVWNIPYEGVCLGQDYIVARDLGRTVKKMDFHFLDYPDNSFDLVFARHSLEHSPMPLLALMEFERVSKYWLGLVLPAPEWYGVKGINHYSVMHHEQIENLLARAGWKVLWNDIDFRSKEDKGEIPHEYWYMCEKTGI